MGEREPDAREAHQRQADEDGASRAESYRRGAARQSADERSGRVGGDQYADPRLREVERVLEVGEERRERGGEQRVHPDERGDEDQETAHWLPAYFRLPFRCDTSALRCRMKAVNALPAAVRPPARVAAPPFADVVAEHLDAVYRYLVYLTGDRAAAEDLA